MLKALDRDVHAITFDCWGTLLGEPDGNRCRRRREEALQRALAAGGASVSLPEAARLLADAHRRHVDHWEQARATGSPEIALWALEPVGIRDRGIVSRLVRELQDAALADPVSALEGAALTLCALAQRGVRLALICDTGFSPGRVVRQLLDRAGLLEWLELHVFSDEAGLTKPQPPVFQAALGGLGTDAGNALHVGDLLRTDVAGARSIGMGTIRIRHLNDDPDELPEADAVADSHDHLREILGV